MLRTGGLGFGVGALGLELGEPFADAGAHGFGCGAVGDVFEGGDLGVLLGVEFLIWAVRAKAWTSRRAAAVSLAGSCPVSSGRRGCRARTATTPRRRRRPGTPGATGGRPGPRGRGPSLAARRHARPGQPAPRGAGAEHAVAA
jgi:hypothetical protein